MDGPTVPRQRAAMGEEAWAALARSQEYVVSQAQLRALGVARGEVRHNLLMRRWAVRTHNVLTTTTGPLSIDQRRWVAVLHAGPTALLGGLSSLEVHGMKGWSRDDITVLVDNPLSFDPVPGVRYFRTRRPLRALAARAELPLCRIEPAVLLFAAYERNRRTAHGALAAVVQQHMTTVEALREWVELLRPLRRASEFRALLADLGGGAQSLAEVDLRKACRDFGLVAPRAQTPRFDRGGKRRFTDCEWDLPDGRVLVLEVEGGFHDDVLQSGADKARHRKLTTTERVVIQCTAYELRYDAAEVIEDLVALGVPRVG